MSKTESQTRAQIIDRLLSESGWNVTDPTQVVEEFDIIVSEVNCVAEPASPYGGHQFSDYVLLGKDRKPLAVVEAKKTSKDAAMGREQAKQYCYNIQKQLGGELPFCFYTNGHEIYFWDLDNYPPRKIVGFPTRDDLERFQYIRRNRKPLTQELINPSIAGRESENYGLTPQRMFAAEVQSAKTNPWSESNFLKSAFLEGCQRADLFEMVRDE